MSHPFKPSANLCCTYCRDWPLTTPVAFPSSLTQRHPATKPCPDVDWYAAFVTRPFVTQSWCVWLIRHRAPPNAFNPVVPPGTDQHPFAGTPARTEPVGCAATAAVIVNPALGFEATDLSATLSIGTAGSVSSATFVMKLYALKSFLSVFDNLTKASRGFPAFATRFVVSLARVSF